MSPRVGTGICTDGGPWAAAARAAGTAAGALDGRDADLAILFASGAYLAEAESVLAAVHEILSPGALIGCGAGGVLREDRELEHGSAVVVWALAADPQARIVPFRVSATIDEADGEIVITGDLGPADATILLADPYTFATDVALDELARIAPAMPVLGGVASGASPAGTGVLFLDREVCEDGAVGVRLDGVELIPCVSQGAAPLGPEATITRAEGNVILELAGRPALETLERIVSELTARERALIAGGVLIGIVVDSGKPEFAQGDFLVRGVLGVDRDSGAVAIGATVQAGQIVRLHARDARSAKADLRDALHLRRDAIGARPVAGSLVFSCNGRGSAMFGVEHHDAGAVARELGGAPSAGFFAAGEIGPVAGRSFMHSFTATIALFPG